MKIEIYNKKTGEILETKDVKHIKGFRIYWSMQCDTQKYGWREVKEQ